MLQSFLGETLGNYRVVGKIASGGMGDVYLAEHVLMRKKAVVKFLRQELTSRTDMLTRFFHEAESAGHIAHPGIADVYDCGFHASGVPYMIMEYLEGETLTARLMRHYQLEELEACTIAAEVASVLCAAHAAGILHRDVKPSNIFLSANANSSRGETARLLDFGVAKLAAEYRTREVTEAGVIIGSPAFMAPEQALSSSGIDARADVYSLGVVLYSCLCGEPPFVGEDFDYYIDAHLHDKPERPRARRPELSEDVERLVLKALQKDPNKRFQTMEELQLALEALIKTHGHSRLDSMVGAEDSDPDDVDTELSTTRIPHLGATAPPSVVATPRPTTAPALPGKAGVTQTAQAVGGRPALGVQVVAAAAPEVAGPRRSMRKPVLIAVGVTMGLLVGAAVAVGVGRDKSEASAPAIEVEATGRAGEALNQVSSTAHESGRLLTPADAGAKKESETGTEPDSSAGDMRNRARPRRRPRRDRVDPDHTPNPFSRKK